MIAVRQTFNDGSASEANAGGFAQSVVIQEVPDLVEQSQLRLASARTAIRIIGGRRLVSSRSKPGGGRRPLARGLRSCPSP